MKGLRYLSAALPAAVALTLVSPAMASRASASTAAETFLVTTTADTNDGRCDAQCSVREAILAANAHSGADTVRIPAGIYTLSIPGVNESAGATGDLDITGPVDLVGAGQGHTILDGARIDRVLSVLGDGPTRISGLTIRHGLAPVHGGGGGGISIGGSAVTLSHVTVTDNSTVAGNTGDSAGGGIETGFLSDEVSLTLTHVSITANRATYGGGISVDTGGARMSHVEISGNTAAALGGGVYSEVSLTTISDGVIAGNRAGGDGGALVNAADVRDELDGVLRLIRVEVDRNSTSGRGGALVNFDGGAASITDSAVARNRAAVGGVAFNAGRLTVVNSTLSGNTSVTGGVLVNRGLDPKQDMFSTVGTGSLRNVTFAGNSAGVQNLPTSGTETVVNTILANRGFNCIRDVGAGAITSKGGNLESGRTCAFAATGDLSARDPRLGRLADNGGPTLTQALLAVSPARDRALAGACPSHDQRGVHRPRGRGCDIGAFEAAPTTPHG